MRVAPPRKQDCRGQPEPEGPALNGRAVLVAEDQPETLRALAALLDRAGAEVAQCDSPLAAAEALAADPSAWDLLVTDYEMPGLDGAALAARARAVAPRLAILLCSGAAETVIGPNRALFDAVLRKPITERGLIAAARAALVRRAATDG